MPRHQLQTKTSSNKTSASNLANTASLLWHALHSLPAPSNQVNWAGFYVLDTSNTSRDQLILGPFQGKVACQTIAFGRGVCGTAAAKVQTQLVPDVEAFPGHIACDGESRSEIVVPVVREGKVGFGLRLGSLRACSTADRGGRSWLSSISTAQSQRDLIRRTRLGWRSWRGCWRTPAISLHDGVRIAAYTVAVRSLSRVIVLSGIDRKGMPST